ncbi:MAG: hypothetical protein L3J24_07000 [Xanthomonadales bacterium]|nr:hypothetical protein [Xanthomonadales bacterium]
MTVSRIAIATIILLCATAVQTANAQPESTLLDQLRSDYTALNTAREEFEQAEKNANTSTAEQADFAEWILQLSRQVAQSCRLLMYSSEHVIPADIPCDEYTASYQAPVAIDINSETTNSEKTAGIVDRFNASLGDFDEKLLREQDRVKARKALASSAGGSGGGMAGSGEGFAEGYDGAEGDSGEPGQSDQQSGQQGDETGTSDNNTSSSAGRPSAGKPSSAPPGTPDGRNDDVIARQLREAAEQETDPELKRKLWAEYRRYKQGGP